MYKRRRKLHPGSGERFSPNRSNLTYTGQMLNAITSKPTRSGFELQIKNTLRSDSSSSNKEIAKYVSEKGRPFFALTRPEQRVIMKKYRDFAIKLARSIIK